MENQAQLSHINFILSKYNRTFLYHRITPFKILGAWAVARKTPINFINQSRPPFPISSLFLTDQNLHDLLLCGNTHLEP